MFERASKRKMMIRWIDNFREKISGKILWKISQESLKSFFCILYSLKKSILKYALKIIAFLTSGHSEKCFWDFEMNLKTFQKYKLLPIKALRGRLLGVQIHYSPPFFYKKIMRMKLRFQALRILPRSPHLKPKQFIYWQTLNKFLFYPNYHN